MRPVGDSSSFVPVPTHKRLNSLLSYEREKVYFKCTMQCTVHFILSIFNVGNVLLWVINKFNFTVCMLHKYHIIYMCINKYIYIYI
jgi:hypothetical protein